MEEKDLTPIVDVGPSTSDELPPLKLKVGRTFKVGFAFLLIQIFWSVYNLVMGPLLTNNFGMNEMWSGVVLALDNVVALLLLPLFGNWSDKTKGKHGKRTPFIVIGSIIAIVFFIGLGVVDYLQQQAIINANIGAVLKDTDSGLFYYLVNGVRHFEDAAKEVVVTNRSAYVLSVVTKHHIGYIVGFIIILMLVLVAMTAFRSPAVSLMPDVTPKPLRSAANAVINLMGAAGMVLATLAHMFLGKEYNSYIPLFITTGGLMLVALAIYLLTVKEVAWGQEMTRVSLAYNIEEDVEEIVEVDENAPKKKMDPAVKRSFLFILASIFFWFMGYNAAVSKYSVYASKVLHMPTKLYTIANLLAGFAAIIAYWPVAKISMKIGRKKTIFIGIGILLLGFTLAIFVDQNSTWLMFVAMIIVGFGWATISVNSYPMVVEMSDGMNIGQYTGYYYSASMAAQIVTPILSGALMDKMGMRYVLFIYALIFVMISGITMIFVKHGEARKITDEGYVEQELIE